MDGKRNKHTRISIVRFLTILTIVTALPLWTSCLYVKEEGFNQEENYLNFSVTSNDVVTRSGGATQETEDRVNNLYIIIFNPENGKKILSEFFKSDKIIKNSNGTYKVNITDLPAGKKKIVAIANIREGSNDGRQRITIEESELDNIKTIDALNKTIVKLSDRMHNIKVEGYELFMMSSDVTDIEFKKGVGVNPKVIPIRRLEAKVEFRIVNSPEFTPESWSVINLPTEERLISSKEPLNLSESKYYSSIDNSFIGTGYGDRFIFYQQESLLEPQNRINGSGLNAYRERARRNKEGTNRKKNLGFKNAPKYVTYVVIKGSFRSFQKTPQVTGHVEYTIPLGYTDAKDPANDYKVERNTHYIYNIRVMGIDDIYVEAVRTEPGFPDSERRPDTEGFASENPAGWVVDAHYDQRLLRITQEYVKNVDIANLAFVVKTPYGISRFTLKEFEANPQKYEELVKWVQFRQNSRTKKPRFNGNQYFYWAGTQDQVNRYPAENVAKPLISLLDFMKLLKHNQELIRQNVGDLYTIDDAIFSCQGDHPAFFTVYIDEYFYDKNPYTGEKVKWQTFVNKPDRELIIALTKHESIDQKSIYYADPLIIIRQMSIKTICEVFDDGKPYYAFGVESINETGYVDLPNIAKKLNTTEDWRFVQGWYNNIDYLNGESREWKSYHSGNYVDQRYNPYDWVKTNPFYACLMRNRDLNRNGKIDNDEIRWYLPSAIQLINLALGDKGLPPGVRLIEERVNGGDDLSQKHWFVSSTPGNMRLYPYFLWSTQGFTIGSDPNYGGGTTGQKTKSYNIRCVRSLGQEPGDNYDKEGMHTLANFIGASANEPGFVLCNRLNNHSKRTSSQFISKGEMPPHRFADDIGMPYDAFYVSERNFSISFTDAMAAIKGTKRSPCADYVEKGVRNWRIPSMREMEFIADCNPVDELCRGKGTPGEQATWFYSSTFLEGSGWQNGLKGFEKYGNGGAARKFHIYNEDGRTHAYGHIRCVKDKNI